MTTITTPQPAPPTIELLDALPPIMRRPLALIDDRAYAATWLPVRVTVTEHTGPDGTLVPCDPPLVQTGTRCFILRDDGRLFGEGGDAPLADLGLDVILPERPLPSRTWSTPGLTAYRAGHRPDPVDVFNRVTDVVSRFLDFDRSLAPQRTMAEMVACYVLATWFLPAFNVVGYLWPCGERGSGKTVLLHTVAEMAYLGHVILAGGSYASLRDLAEYGATLAFDDTENLTNLHKADPDKRALLLAGNRRGSTVTMKELGPDRVWHTRHVNAFCPRLFSAIRLPDSVLASRSIVIPLVRTPDRYRANADPLDHDAWPHDRRQLIDDLWALSLAHLPELRSYERSVNRRARLAGRTLEPWRAILAVALWIDARDVPGRLQREQEFEPREPWEGLDELEMETGILMALDADEMAEPDELDLWGRMEALSVRYQHERSDLEADDITALVIRALCLCAVDTVKASGAFNREQEIPSHFVFATQQITRYTQSLTTLQDGDPDAVTVRRVGRALSRMRLHKAPRPGGKGGRRWNVKISDLERWTAAYGLTLPERLNPGPQFRPLRF